MNTPSPAPGKLIIARHNESEWNKLGVWTGSRDIHLTEHGFEMSEKMGKFIEDMPVDEAFVSTQIRSYETLLGMERTLNKLNIPVTFSAALNERDYGDYTGKNKWEVEKLIGEDAFNKLRRGWDYPVPNGETLQVVYARVVPYFLQSILPKVAAGEDVLVVSHGNAIRALMKYIENMSDTEVENLEMLFGTFIIYTLDESGHMISKESRGEPAKTNA